MSELTLPCPECGRPMLVRQNRINGSEFLGCTGYPDACRHTQAIPEYLKLRREGVPELPGFDAT